MCASIENNESKALQYCTERLDSYSIQQEHKLGLQTLHTVTAENCIMHNCHKSDDTKLSIQAHACDPKNPVKVMLYRPRQKQLQCDFKIAVLLLVQLVPLEVCSLGCQLLVGGWCHLWVHHILDMCWPVSLHRTL